MSTAFLHFKGELAALAKAARRPYAVTRKVSIKDVVESLGVPHTEIYGLHADGQPVDLAHILEPGQRIDILPGEPPVDVTAPHPLRAPLPGPKFVADVNAGKLATYLRLLGIDTAYRNDLTDAEVARLAFDEHRVVLTRDRGVLRRRIIEWGRLITANDPVEQARDVLRFFGLAGAATPFTLCVRCNAPLVPVDKAEVLHLLELRTRKYYDDFHRCPACGRVYWAGSHHGMMAAMARRLSEP